MRTYTNFCVRDGYYQEEVTTFDSMEAALSYLEEYYGKDNVIEQLVQIDASNEDDEHETFSELEIYDLMSELGYNG